MAVGMERRSGKGLLLQSLRIMALLLAELVMLCVAAFECSASDENCWTQELSWRPRGAKL